VRPSLSIRCKLADVAAKTASELDRLAGDAEQLALKRDAGDR
jgi:hypothetical protein